MKKRQIYLVIIAGVFFNTGEIVEYKKEGWFSGNAYVYNGTKTDPIAKEKLVYIGEI